MSEDMKQDKQERQATKTTIYKIPLRQITANHNPRHPLSEKLQQLGWGVLCGGDKDLWALGVSQNPEDRARYAELVKEHDPELFSLAATMLTQGQLQAAEVRDNGKKGDGNNSYTLIYGCRRALAILLNYCLLGKPREPTLEAKLVKGNNQTLLHRAFVENVRKNPSPIEDAKSFQMAVNNGESLEEIAEARGVSVQTIRNRLALLELPRETQEKVHRKEMPATKALAQLKGQPGNQPADSPTANGLPSRLRSRKLIAEAMGEFSESTPEYKALAWVLGLREKIRE